MFSRGLMKPLTTRQHRQEIDDPFGPSRGAFCCHQAMINRIKLLLVQTDECFSRQLWPGSQSVQKILWHRCIRTARVGRILTPVGLGSRNLRQPRRLHSPRCDQPGHMVAIFLTPDTARPTRGESLKPTDVIQRVGATIDPTPAQRLDHRLFPID